MCVIEFQVSLRWLLPCDRMKWQIWAHTSSLFLFLFFNANWTKNVSASGCFHSKTMHSRNGLSCCCWCYCSFCFFHMSQRFFYPLCFDHFLWLERICHFSGLGKFLHFTFFYRRFCAAAVAVVVEFFLLFIDVAFSLRFKWSAWDASIYLYM